LNVNTTSRVDRKLSRPEQEHPTVAWVGVIAIIGLALCGLDAVRDWRRARHPDAPDDADRPWWRRRWVLMAAVAAVLVVLLVAAVVVLLGGSTSTPKIVVPPTTTAPPTGPTTSTTTASRGRPPQQVHVEVINASGVPKAAATKAAALTGLGYPVVGTANGAVRPGSIVECKVGFESEATALATAVGPGTTVQPFPVPAPPGSATADCVVVLGK
jgi:LytR cell envelope-related transcriptional attenuator